MPAPEPRRRSKLRGALALAALAFAAGCASSTAPYGWLPKAERAQQEAFGGWVQVHFPEGAEPEFREGELIVVTADSLHVLASEGLLSLAWNDIERAELIGYEGAAGVVGLWSAMGGLSTLSHGFYLIMSAPVWIVSGIVCTRDASRDSRLRYPQGDRLAMRPFARFPTGWPEGLDRASLRAKPGTPPTSRELYRHRGILDRRPAPSP